MTVRPCTIKIDVPDGRSGDWKVDTFTVDAEDVRLHNLRESIRRGRFILPGTYKRLSCGPEVVMSNTPAEVEDLWDFFDNARGNVLVHGLGLGVALKHALALRYSGGEPRVKQITVIEQSPDVIKLVGPTYLADPRVKIIEADAMDWRPPRGAKYDCIWCDIFDDICSDNVPTIEALSAMYDRKAAWIGFWGHEDYL